MRLQRLIVVALAAGTVAIAGCGGSDSEDVTKTLQQKGEELQQQGQDFQKKAADLKQQFENGEITAEEYQAELKKGADALTGKAKDAANDTLDAVKDNANLSDDQKQQIEDAHKQLEGVTVP